MPDVKVWGELREIMHEGKTGARVSLVDALEGGPKIAIGALSDLRGEVTVLGDRALLSFGNPDVFTHHGQHSHFHLLPADGAMTAHVDSAGVSAGTTIAIPQLRP